MEEVVAESELPRIDFCGTTISRMLLGHNPLCGFAHRPNDPDAGRRLREYFTDEKVLETMITAVRCGINAFHGRGDENIFRWLANYRAWAASQQERLHLHWLAQTAPDHYQDGHVEPNIETIADHQPMAIYIHGATSDKLYQAGQTEELRSLVRFIQNLGFPAGIGSHRPEVIRLAEERQYGADFYVLSLRSVDDELDVCRDEVAAANAIRTIRRPFVAIKVLAAGRLPVTEAFRYAASALKPVDVMTVGMLDYEIEQDVRLAAQAFREVEQAHA